MSKIECVILAGGKGSRLQPFTKDIPKPLVPIGEISILEILIRTLKKHNITNLHLAVNHLADQIKSFLGDGSCFDVTIQYSSEEKELSTVAPLILIENLPDHFLVVNGDLITDLDFKKLYDAHINSKALLTVATCIRENAVDYGVVEFNDDNRIIGFKEKPVQSYSVSMGVYVFSKKVLSYVPDNIKFGFDDLMYALLKEKVTVHSFPYKGYWLDVGRLEDYRKANLDIEKIKSIYL